MSRSRPGRARKAARSAYHHGNLRAALVAQALELLEREGIGAVGLRAVARAAGVSGAAPYSHFADKAVLLAAVAEVGFRRLAAALVDAADAASNGNVLKALGRAYVAFALRQRALYRLMFGPPFAAPDAHPELAAASHACFSVLEDAVRAQIGAQAPQARVHATAMGAWAMVHGLAMLILDRKALDGAPSHAAEAALVDSIVGVFSAGIEGAKP